MEEVKENIEEKIYPERTFRKNLTMGILEDLDIPLDKLDKIDDLVKTTKDLAFNRDLMNALILTGPPITRDTDPDELVDLVPKLTSFLEKSRRLTAARDSLKMNRSPKR